MEKILIDRDLLERVDSLLVNLQNEKRPVDKLRSRVINVLNEPTTKYAIHSGGDVAFRETIKEIERLGYKAINPDQHISRVGYNVIGIIAGNWMAWSESFWESIGHKVIDCKAFYENPKKYIEKQY